MSLSSLLDRSYRKLNSVLVSTSRSRMINSYLANGKRPWSKGYELFKYDFIQKILSDDSLLSRFSRNLPLPQSYGEFLDERVVEYPWLISRLNQDCTNLLDAGSILNFDFILNHPNLSQKQVSIITLEPESSCYWKNSISYLYGDIRDLPFKDNLFNEVVSISTIEHVGMNNSIYSSNENFIENKQLDFLKAVSEFNRAVRKGGKVYITVPFGKHTDFGWYQQFNSEMVGQIIDAFQPDKFIETFFCYEFGGWSITTKEHCQEFEGFNIHDTKYFNPNSDKDYDPDFAACSRAIAALELWK